MYALFVRYLSRLWLRGKSMNSVEMGGNSDCFNLFSEIGEEAIKFYNNFDKCFEKFSFLIMPIKIRKTPVIRAFPFLNIIKGIP